MELKPCKSQGMSVYATVFQYASSQVAARIDYNDVDGSHHVVLTFPHGRVFRWDTPLTLEEIASKIVSRYAPKPYVCLADY